MSLTAPSISLMAETAQQTLPALGDDEMAAVIGGARTLQGHDRQRKALEQERDALVAVGTAVGRALGAGDLMARFGGEECVLLLSHGSAQQGLTFAERLRAAIASAPVGNAAQGLQPHVTASLGMTDASGTTAELAELLQRADRAMDQAKKAGRNRVVLARPTAPAAPAPAADRTPGPAVSS